MKPTLVNLVTLEAGDIFYYEDNICMAVNTTSGKSNGYINISRTSEFRDSKIGWPTNVSGLDEVYLLGNILDFGDNLKQMIITGEIHIPL